MTNTNTTHAQAPDAQAVAGAAPAPAPEPQETPKAVPEQANAQAPAPAEAKLQFENTNKWDTRTLVTMALMCAISVLLSFIESPAMFAPFLRLDISVVPAMVVGFAYGGGAGVLVGIVAAVAHAALTGNWVGCIMNIIVTVAFVLPAAAIYKRKHTISGAIVGLVAAIVCQVAGSIVGNLIIDPVFYGLPFDAVVGYIVPAFIPFNLIKGAVNAVLTLAVYKSISNLITPKKKQVKGR